jgi:hypothetical protein
MKYSWPTLFCFTTAFTVKSLMYLKIPMRIIDFRESKIVDMSAIDAK